MVSVALVLVARSVALPVGFNLSISLPGSLETSFCKNFKISTCNFFCPVPVQMLLGQPPIVLPIKLLLESMFNRGSQSGPSLMLEHERKWTSCLRQPAALCHNCATAACNPLQCHESERFLPTGRYNNRSMAVEQIHESFPSPRSEKSHLTCQLKSFDHSLQCAQFRSTSNDRQFGPSVALTEQRKSIE